MKIEYTSSIVYKRVFDCFSLIIQILPNFHLLIVRQKLGRPVYGADTQQSKVCLGLTYLLSQNQILCSLS